MKNFYITTPIYYVNDIPHIGHAYTTLACDVTSRFMKLYDYNVKFITGTDEHGQKVEKSAKDKGVSTQEFTDKVSTKFKDLCKIMNYNYDDFIRTTEERHKLSAQELWKILKEKGDIYLDKYAGWYSIRDEAFYAEDEIKDGLSPTGSKVEWVEESSYFFKLSNYQDKLLEFFKNNPNFLAPDMRKNEVISFVESGLRDLSISRTTFNWGIPVPNDEKHIMYVWMDALSNYLTVLGFPNKSSKDYNDFWVNADELSSVHIVGKDILRFHAIYWPAFLMAAKLPLPKRIFAHGWWTNEGQKISKSLGNTIDPIQLVDKFGLDNVRYFLLRNMIFGNDGDFSESVLKSIINSDLVNNIGNFIQRVLSFIYNHAAAKIPQPSDLTNNDKEILKNIYEAGDQIFTLLKKQEFYQIINKIVSIGDKANKYIDENAPWKLRKTDITRMNTILYVSSEVIRVIAILLQPLVPDSSEKILEILNIDENKRNIMHSSSEEFNLANITIKEPYPIFKKIE